MRQPRPEESPISVFQIGLGVLALAVVGALIADAAWELPREASRLIQALDLAACAFFFIDFCIRFQRADNKLRFLKWGWIDLLASVPNVDFLRAGRLVRVLRLIQLWRGIRLSHRLVTLLIRNRRRNVFSSVVLLAFLLVAFSSIGALICEHGAPGATITTAEDAVWWSVTTIKVGEWRAAGFS